MSKGPGTNNGAKLRMTPAAAQKRCRELASCSSNVVWTDHIKERMAERGFDADAVRRVLRGGDVEEEPRETEDSGDWKFKVVLKMPTGRVAGVVVVIEQGKRLILITAEWEDSR